MHKIISLNQGWKFIQEDIGLPEVYPENWQDIDLPHTWNAIDAMDGNGGYNRGQYWYAKKFVTPKQPLEGGRVYVEFPAAGQQATVYVNGTQVVYHEGGYSIFRADITDVCKNEEENLLVVACSNEEKSNVYPQTADFAFYGGLYRGVNLISVPDTHFDLSYFGTSGIRVVSKPCKECGGALFEINTWIKNADENFTVLYTVVDKEGNEVAGGSRPADDSSIKLYVPDSHLWSPENPYLYKVTAYLMRRNEVYDEVIVQVGVREMSCDPQKGFYLNGELTPLRGVSRHQDKLYQGSALSKDDHYLDGKIIKEIGANTVRLAHYQHSQEFYDVCDELGLVVWAEIPFISVMNEDPKAHDNCISQMTELILQNINHPSICFWGLSNEILIGGISQKLVDNHYELNKLTKQLDPTRLTTIAHLSTTPMDGPMHRITDVESYNHYFGWYGGKLADNAPWLDKFHGDYPDICIGVSEYGCDSVITYHGPNPACKDYSEEYQALYHETMAQIFDERPWIWGTHVWNMFDFGCPARLEGGVGGRNNKGLVTVDRKVKKDAFYVYQAYWAKKPMVHIAGRRYAQRSGESTVVKVYSNQPQVSLYVNGKLVETKEAYRVFAFDVQLEEGQNILLAVADQVKDSITLEKVEIEPKIYVLPEISERAEGVANWFKTMGTMELDTEMQFPEDRYSIKATFEELAKNEEAWNIAGEAIQLTLGYDPRKYLDMMANMTLEGQFNDNIDRMPKGFVEIVNMKLNQIKK